MGIQIDANGIMIDFAASGYRKSNKDNWDDLWCKCDFSFRSDNWLNYKSVSNEVLLSCEIDELERSLTQLLDGEITEKNMKPARTIKFERHNRITQGHKVSIQYIYSLTL